MRMPLGRVALVRHPSLGAGPVILTDDTFNQVLSAPQAVVDFWSPKCAPCLAWKPTFEEIAADPSNPVLMATLNATEFKKTAEAHRIESLPTMIFFRDGLEIYRTEGLMEREAFLEKMKGVFADEVVVEGEPVKTAAPAPVAVNNSIPWGWVAAGAGVMSVLMALALRK